MAHNKKPYARLVCSSFNKHLINTVCREQLIKVKPDLEGANITEDMILTSMIKNYTGKVTLQDLKEEFENGAGTA